MSFTVRCGYFPRQGTYELGTWDTYAEARYEAEKHRLMRADMDERPDWQEIVDSDPPLITHQGYDLREPDTVYRCRKAYAVNPNEWTDWAIETWGEESITDSDGQVVFSHMVHVAESE